ncbi:MAG TPA: alpha-1,4-glucan--maltose-1-phosphate maltosyltransferase [Burkholderiales bacterium]|nr:alpha-1,4-glucan--maltose-1-phosphate maltosyltransferase [Burkholderiales bacterium]
MPRDTKKSGATRSAAAALVEAGRRRVAIEAVTPQIEDGRFAAKRVAGEAVIVEADIFTDGHDAIAAELLWRRAADRNWQRAPMMLFDNDRWRGEFPVTHTGRWLYTVRGWVDAFASWRNDLEKRRAADQSGSDLALAFLTGAALIERAEKRVTKADAKILAAVRERLSGSANDDEKFAAAQDAALAEIMAGCRGEDQITTYAPELAVTVERERARCGAWYEMFPRSTRTDGAHGTFEDCIARVPYVAGMGFDVLYLPPIHPIGSTDRKGRNNVESAAPGDVGSPWAIGSADGGHKAIDPALGTLADFRRLVAAARAHDLEIALDIAFQCSPDHPYVREHPQWFRARPDGSIQFAENPPKKYQDIYPFDFECDDWRALWEELKSVFLFWIGEGVQIFRVDNPHTKPFRFWEWVIAEIRRDHPDTIFLAEAFTRPKVMHHLARLGFSQSYTYFTWRNTKYELTEYFTELTQDRSREYFRPNVWPNTPDILHEYLQFGGRPAFVARLVLAATLSANYGIYGPAFELCENHAREPGSEEYLNSEKYEIRRWDVARSDSLRDVISRINAVRRDNPALHSDWSLRFHAVDNDAIIAYSKCTSDRSNIVIAVVNLDPHHVQSGWLDLPLDAFDLAPDQPYQMHDLLSGARYIWQGPRNFVQLDPQILPAHVFGLRRRVHNERDFDAFI